jgi:hypothetical protein
MNKAFSDGIIVPIRKGVAYMDEQQRRVPNLEELDE